MSDLLDKVVTYMKMILCESAEYGSAAEALGIRVESDGLPLEYMRITDLSSGKKARVIHLSDAVEFKVDNPYLSTRVKAHVFGAVEEDKPVRKAYVIFKATHWSLTAYWSQCEIREIEPILYKYNISRQTFLTPIKVSREVARSSKHLGHNIIIWGSNEYLLIRLFNDPCSYLHLDLCIALNRIFTVRRVIKNALKKGESTTSSR